jgi:hypothetical protein
MKKRKHAEGGWEEEEEEVNQRVCPPPQACSKGKESGERREVFGHNTFLHINCIFRL